MSEPKVPPKRLASELRPGDRIGAAVLPGALTPGDVLFVYPYPGRDGKAWVFVAYREAGYSPESERFLASSEIPVEHVADTGLDFSREADPAPTPTSRRVEPHTGGMEGAAKPATVHASTGDAVVVDAEPAPAAGVLQVAGGHVVHECCGKLDGGPHRNFCEHYRLPDRRTCVDPGDQEHDHESCKDAVAEERERGLAPAAMPAHYQTTGWTGSDSGSGAACACGTKFDGFESLSAALRELNRHIDDANAELERVHQAATVEDNDRHGPTDALLLQITGQGPAVE